MGSSHSTQANPEAAGFEITYIDVCGTADGELTASYNRPTPRNNLRVSFGVKPGVAMVKGFPSTGGVYILPSCSGTELDFLGLDRFETTPRPGLSLNRTGEEGVKKEEDALCAPRYGGSAVVAESGRVSGDGRAEVDYGDDGPKKSGAQEAFLCGSSCWRYYRE